MCARDGKRTWAIGHEECKDSFAVDARAVRQDGVKAVAFQDEKLVHQTQQQRPQ